MMNFRVTKESKDAQFREKIYELKKLLWKLLEYDTNLNITTWISVRTPEGTADFTIRNIDFHIFTDDFYAVIKAKDNKVSKTLNLEEIAEVKKYLSDCLEFSKDLEKKDVASLSCKIMELGKTE